MGSPSEKLWQDFGVFGRLQLESRDCDPAYPVLRALYDQNAFTPEQALWHTFLFVAYYRLDSATKAFYEQARPGVPLDVTLRLPTGTERRGLRVTANMAAHLKGLVAFYGDHGGFKSGFAPIFTKDSTPRSNWGFTQVLLRSLPFNGRWAAYKTGEILQKVHQWPLEPTDMGNDFSTGPRAGLALLFPEEVPQGSTPGAVAILDRQGEEAQRFLAANGIRADIAQVETLLCDFHAMHEGRYYPGHDIDQLRGLIRQDGSDVGRILMDAFQDAFPHWSTGANGADKYRRGHYKRTGLVE